MAESSSATQHQVNKQELSDDSLEEINNNVYALFHSKHGCDKYSMVQYIKCGDISDQEIQHISYLMRYYFRQCMYNIRDIFYLTIRISLVSLGSVCSRTFIDIQVTFCFVKLCLRTNICFK